jgi:pyrroline-5-carboxylate reductase
MPNTPAAIGRGITGAFANEAVSERQRTLARDLLAAVGAVEWVPSEDLIDAVTAVSGSGPAYVFYLTECLAAAGAAIGLDPALAMRLARATVEGAGALMTAEPATGADQLRRNVTSPKGTTAAALDVLGKDEALSSLLGAAVAAAHRRAQDLGQ